MAPLFGLLDTVTMLLPKGIFMKHNHIARVLTASILIALTMAVVPGVRSPAEAAARADVIVDPGVPTLTHSPAGPVPLGSTVTETLTAVDEDGDPTEGLDVEFLRRGPGDESADPVNTTTDANGQAFYSFEASRTGTAQVAAIVSDSASDVQRVVTDSVTVFGGDPAKLKVKIFAPNNGAQNDHVKVKVVPHAAGAMTTLYRIEDGRKVPIRTGSLDSAGIVVFRVRDLNGDRGTYYQAHVASTSSTPRATSGRHFTR